MADVLQSVLEYLHLVGLLGQRIGADADLALAAGRHFVMVHLDLQAHFLQCETHRAADVLEGVHRRHRKIAALHAGPVALVAVHIILAAVPRPLNRVDLGEAAAHLRAPFDAVEYEELVLGTEQGVVRDTGRLKISLGPLRERARIPAVALHGHGLDHIAANVDRGLFVERIDHRGFGVGHQYHVRLVDALPSGDRRAVEHLAIPEKAVVHQTRRNRHVLFFANGVGKAKICEFRLFLLDQFQNISGSHDLPPRGAGNAFLCPAVPGL